MNCFLTFLSDLFDLVCILSYFVIETLNNIWWYFFSKYKDLTEDVILITGAGSGIGRLMCLEFSKYCPNLIAWDFQENALNETAYLVLKNSGHKLYTYYCDLRDRNQIVETANKVLREVGSVTILINNAGIVTAKCLLDLQPEEIEDTFKVNVLAHFYTIQAFLPSMVFPKRLQSNISASGDVIKHKCLPHGHIVNIASVAGSIPAVGLSDYCASKAASLLMMNSLELELREMNLENVIHVTNILPFLMNTQMFAGCQPLRPWLFPTVDASCCARRVVQAVRANERTVYVTSRYRMLPIIKYLLPSETLHRLYGFAGNEQLSTQLQAERSSKKNN